MRAHIVVSSDGRTFEGDVELRLVGGSVGKSRNAKPQVSSGKARVTKPSDAIERLYRNGFFKAGHKLSEVVKELEKDGFNFGRPSVAMALGRAQYLQTRGTQGAYTYVQKFPPTEEVH